jgi:hypothetical protein
LINNQLYESITVFRSYSGYILIEDNGQIAKREPNQYFNLHTGVIESIDSEAISSIYQVVEGENKIIACDIYLHWKWTKKTIYVVKQAWDKFPINGCHKPSEEIIRAINSIEYKKIDSVSPKQEKKLSYRPQDSNLERIKQIRNIVINQDIRFLCHFTHIENLASILNYGLITRLEIDLRSNSINPHINDIKRLDGYRDSISLSISYPNYQMFFKYNKDNQNSWVVICLAPDILWELDCAFLPNNAASNSEYKSNLKKFKRPASLVRIFKDYGSRKRDDLNIPKRYTTNPQSEVLVFGNIPESYFMNICFFSETAKLSWLDSNSTDKERLFIFTKKCFSARRDYKLWKKNNDRYTDSEINYDDKIPF